MIEIKEDFNCAALEKNVNTIAQVVDIDCANPKTAIQARLCYLMQNGGVQRGANERLYTWAKRIGIASSTMTRILHGSNSMQEKVAKKISEHTGANVEWLMTGLGSPFVGQPAPAIQTAQAIKKLELLSIATDKVSQLDISDSLKSALRDIVYAIDTGNLALLDFSISQLLQQYPKK